VGQNFAWSTTVKIRTTGDQANFLVPHGKNSHNRGTKRNFWTNFFGLFCRTFLAKKNIKNQKVQTNTILHEKNQTSWNHTKFPHNQNYKKTRQHANQEYKKKRSRAAKARLRGWRFWPWASSAHTYQVSPN
jgi:hypothetical protein